jgi:hypothetical protein
MQHGVERPGRVSNVVSTISRLRYLSNVSSGHLLICRCHTLSSPVSKPRAKFVGAYAIRSVPSVSHCENLWPRYSPFTMVSCVWLEKACCSPHEGAFVSLKLPNRRKNIMYFGFCRLRQHQLPGRAQCSPCTFATSSRHFRREIEGMRSYPGLL